MTRAATQRTIPARFDGFCRTCKQTYSAGQPITKVGFKTWVHAACANGQTAKAASEPPAIIPFAPPSQTAPVQTMDAEAVRQAVRAELERATLSVDDSDVRPIVLAELAKAGIVKHIIEIKTPTGTTFAIEGKAHAELDWAVSLASRRKPVLLVGPAGSGKTHLASQIAQSLGLGFAFISCSAGMSEGQLLGRLIPTGESGKFEYIRSEFVRCYEEGGVFLFDELDAADSNTLLVLNSALANGHMAVPNRPGKPVAVRHPDFVCIAAANTFGTGASREYVGRNQLDESTLDRFRIGQIELDYDAEIEAALCPDEALRTRLQGYRTNARDAKVRRLVSMRFLRDAYDMKQVGATNERIDKALFSGWTRDEIAKVKN
jgi:cobaltochelatase CobS